MIDHVVIGVADLEASRAFYEGALDPLGLRVIVDRPGYLGFGERMPFFFLATRQPSASVHVAFSAERPDLCDAFHAGAITAGGIDNGAPGSRPAYHEHYYGAFVLGPDGNNLEAACHSA